MGRPRDDGSAQAMWVATADLPQGGGVPSTSGGTRYWARPAWMPSLSSCAPRSMRGWGGRVWRRAGNVRLLLVGYVEGLDSERAMAWRAADSWSLRSFLRLAPPAAAPDHSTISRTRRLLSVETHEAVFTWVLQQRADAGLVRAGRWASTRRRWRRMRRCGSWKGQPSARDAVYANRRRIRGERSRGLLRCRGELLERPVAHLYETGGMRRVHLRGHPKLGLLLRHLIGVDTPRNLQGRAAALFRALFRLFRDLWGLLGRLRPLFMPHPSRTPSSRRDQSIHSAS